MPLEVTDTYYKVAVKNDFFKTMLEENYAQVIEGVLAGIMSKNIKLIIETMDNGNSGSEAAEEMPAVPANANSSSCLMKIPPCNSPMKAT